MRVAQIVSTIIGEGLYVGTPCLLVRLAGCNLRCSWCDTPEARRGGSEVPFAKLVERGIKAPQKWILLTGGEPLLQRSTGKLVKRWVEGGKKVLVETNGTLPLERVLIDGVFISMDVKTPSSGESSKVLRKNLELLRSGDAIKLVIADRRDFAWAVDFVNGLQTEAAIFFQPAWGRLSPKRLSKWIVADGLGVRLSVQLHKLIKLP